MRLLWISLPVAVGCGQAVVYDVTSGSSEAIELDEVTAAGVSGEDLLEQADASSVLAVLPDDEGDWTSPPGRFVVATDWERSSARLLTLTDGMDGSSREKLVVDAWVEVRSDDGQLAAEGLQWLSVGVSGRASWSSASPPITGGAWPSWAARAFEQRDSDCTGAVLGLTLQGNVEASVAFQLRAVDDCGRRSVLADLEAVPTPLAE